MSNDIDIRLLRSFVTVVRTGSITGAAITLKRSQPAISMQLKKLEELMGHPLLSRDEQRFALTEQGTQLLPYAERMVDLNDRLFAVLRTESEERLRFGFPEDLLHGTLVVSILESLRREWPRAIVDIVCDGAETLLERFHQGELDLVVTERVAVPPLPPRSWLRPLGWLVHSGFQYQSGMVLPLVLFPRGCLYHRLVVEELARQGVEHRTTVTASNWSGVQAAVLAGCGISVMPVGAVAPGLRLGSGSQEGLPSLPTIVAAVQQAATARTPVGNRLVELLMDNVRGVFAGFAEWPSNMA